MGISSEQLGKLQKKIVKKVYEKLGISPSEGGSCTRFNELSDDNREAILEVAKKVCKKFAEKHDFSFTQDESGDFVRVAAVTVVGVYVGGKRISIFDF